MYADTHVDDGNIGICYSYTTAYAFGVSFVLQEQQYTEVNYLLCA